MSKGVSKSDCSELGEMGADKKQPDQSDLMVADFEQSGKVRSETRQLLQKYLLGVLGYIGSFVYFYKGLSDQLEHVGAIVLSFFVYVILIKCVNLYTEQIQIATHHIRNQASHRLGGGSSLLGLQGVKLFSRQRSLSGIVRFFVPHWTTRTEFSMVVAMVASAFIPIFLSLIIWKKAAPESYIVYFLLEFAIALMFLNKSLLDIFAYLVASRVTFPDNPVPTMKKTPLVAMPRWENVEDSFFRNRRLFSSTLFVFATLCLLFFGSLEFSGNMVVVYRLALHLTPFVLIVWFIRVINTHMFDNNICRKSGLGVHAIFMLVTLLLGVWVFLVVAPIIDKLPPFDRKELWWLCAIMVGGVYLLYFIYKDRPFRRCAFATARSRYTVYSFFYIFVCVSVYIASSTRPLKMAVASKVIEGVKGQAAIFAENYSTYCNFTFLSAVLVCILLFLFWPTKKNKKVSWKLRLWALISWKKVLVLFVAIFVAVLFLEKVDKFFSAKKWSKQFAGMVSYLALLMAPVVFSLCTYKIVSEYISGTAIPEYKKHGLYAMHRVIPSYLRTLLAVSSGLSVGTLIYNYSTDLFLALVGISVLAVLFLRKEKERPLSEAQYSLQLAALLCSCLLIIIALNRLQYDYGGFAGRFMVNKLTSSGVLNKDLFLSPTMEAVLWPVVFFAINIFIFGLGVLYTLFTFLVSAATRYEYKSIMQVLNRKKTLNSTWPSSSWRVERPKKTVFIYLQCVLILLLVIASAHPWGAELLALRYCIIGALLYLAISELTFEVELLYCGRWLTEFSGMHLIADNYCKDVGQYPKLVEYLCAHGLTEKQVLEFIDKHNHNTMSGESKELCRQIRVVIRRLIDNSFYTTLKKRMNSIFKIDHSTSRVENSIVEETAIEKHNGLNNDRYIFSRALRFVNRSSVFTPLRFLFLMPWKRELMQIYDNLGQPKKIWKERASFLTNTPVHSSVIKDGDQKRKLTILLSATMQSDQRLLVGLAKAIHESVHMAEKLIAETKLYSQEHDVSDGYRLFRAITRYQKKYGMELSISPHECLNHCLLYVANRLTIQKLEKQRRQIQSLLDRAEVVAENALNIKGYSLGSLIAKYQKNIDASVENEQVLEEICKESLDQIDAYVEIDLVFMGNCGSKHYDQMGIPYVYKNIRNYGFWDLLSIKHHLSFLSTHYHPRSLLRMKPDLVLMCGASYFNISLAKFARKINPAIKLVYVSPPHVELSTHYNDQRLLDIVRANDLILASTSSQHGHYVDCLKKIDSVQRRPLMYDYEGLKEKIKFNGYALPSFFVDNISKARLRTLREEIDSYVNDFAYVESDSLVIYAGTSSYNLESSFILALKANEMRRDSFKDVRISFVLPDIETYDLFLAHTKSYFENELGIVDPANTPFDFTGFDIVILKRVYSDLFKQRDKINREREDGKESSGSDKTLLAPLTYSRIFGDIYELDVSTILTDASCIMGFSDGLMNIMSLFVPSITISCRTKVKTFMESLTGAHIYGVAKGVSSNSVERVPSWENHGLVNHEGPVPLYTEERVPSQLFSWFMRQRDETVSEFTKSVAVLKGAQTKTETWVALLELVQTMMLPVDERKPFYEIANQVIRDELIYSGDKLGRVSHFYRASAIDILTQLFDERNHHNGKGLSE